jgi:hypothetical protein
VCAPHLGEEPELGEYESGNKSIHRIEEDHLIFDVRIAASSAWEFENTIKNITQKNLTPSLFAL